MKQIALCFLSLYFGLGASALDIHVAPTGHNNNPGTISKPMASLAGARDRIRQLRTLDLLNETVRVIVAQGTYFMTEPLALTEQDSGTEQTPVTFMANATQKATFVGGIQIDHWEKVSETLWKTCVPEVPRYGLYFEQLYVNGQRATRAKSPNQGFYVLKGVKETIVNKGKGRVPAMAVQTLNLFEPAATDLATFTKPDFDDALVTLYHKWDNTRKRITAFDTETSSIFTVGKGMKPWNSLDKKTRFTVENYRAALDACGEWYLERDGTLYYVPCEGDDITNMDVFAPVTNRFMTLTGNPSSGKKIQHLRFKNLCFKVAGYRTPLLGNEPAQAASPVDAVVMADYAHKIDFVQCEIAQIGTSAIWFQNACTDCSVSHCYLHDLGAGGLKIGAIQKPNDPQDLTQRIKVDNNIIRSGGHVFPCAVGVSLFQTSDNRVTHNDIANFRYSGVSVGWTWGYSPSPAKRNIIEYNHIHHLGWGELCDMGGVYCLGKSEGTSVSHNLIHHIYSFDYGGWGLYTDEGSTGIIMENNLVYACKNSGFHQHYGRENTIRNNIFAGNIRAQLQATRVEEHLSFNFTHNIVWFSTGSLLSSRWHQVNMHSDKNCYWDTRTQEVRFGKASLKEWQASGKDLNSVIADPKFVNPEAFDFRVRNKAVMQDIGFKPFDTTKAGVYGSEAWTKLAQLDPAVKRSFDDTVAQLEAQTK